MTLALRDKVQDSMKSALKARDKPRLGAVRLIMAAIKQREVDERIVLDDTQTISVLEKMAKQRRESSRLFREAAREELAAQEDFELDVIQEFLPQALSDAELEQEIERAVSESGATSPRDMGKVIALLKPRVAGKADMSAVSGRVKARLTQ